MGWTSCILLDCPKGTDRIAEALAQEGYHTSDIADIAMIGTTIYMAVRYGDRIYGTVILTDYDKYTNRFFTKVIGEDMGPAECDCPKRIIDKLSDTDNEYALDWRRRCAEKRRAKAERRKNDGLSKLQYGATIRLLGSNGGRDFTGTILTVEERRGHRVFVDYGRMCRFSKPLVESVGWELVSK